MKKLNKQETFMILIVAFAYNSVYSLAFMKGLYYTLMQSGLGLTHFKLGQLYSLYGLFSMFSYLCGAFFLNRFKCWKLVAGSSILIGILTMTLLFLPPYKIMLGIFAIIGFLLGATFYPAHLQILHQIGGIFKQGAVFSLFFVLNSVLGVIFTIVGFGLTSISAPSTQLVRFLFLFFAVLNIAAGVLSVIFLRKIQEDDSTKAPFSFQQIKMLFGNKKLWTVILIVFTNYIAFSSLNYILPFINDTFTLSPAFTNVLTIVRVYLIGIVAGPVAGSITDRLHSASRLMKYSFLLSTITLIGMLLLFGGNAVGTILCLLLACLFINMGKSMALITIDEARIPPFLYSMSISFLSFCAYSPDAFYYSLSGFLLDVFPAQGYTLIFLLVAVTSIVGFLASKSLEQAV